MIAVAGVSGHTGRAVAETLLNKRAPIRVIVRDEKKSVEWKAQGADVAVASLDDVAALTRALTGADAAYLLIPPAYAAEDALAAQAATRDAVARAIVDSRVGHVVFLSSIGAQHASGTGPVRALHDAEEALRKVGLPVTLLRAPYFLENWVAVLSVATSQHVLPSFIPLDQAIETAATADIGEHAADLLTAPPRSALRIVEFGGPRKLSPRDIARDLSALVGQAVAPAQAPLDQVVPTFAAAGFSTNAARLVEEMYDAIGHGRLEFEGPGAPHARGRRTPADVFRPLLAQS